MLDTLGHAALGATAVCVGSAVLATLPAAEEADIRHRRRLRQTVLMAVVIALIAVGHFVYDLTRVSEAGDGIGATAATAGAVLLFVCAGVGVLLFPLVVFTSLRGVARINAERGGGSASGESRDSVAHGAAFLGSLLLALLVIQRDPRVFSFATATGALFALTAWVGHTALAAVSEDAPEG